jgi:hypothetical protein
MCLVRKNDILPEVIDGLFDMRLTVKRPFLLVFGRDLLLNIGLFVYLTSICMFNKLCAKGVSFKGNIVKGVLSFIGLISYWI